MRAAEREEIGAAQRIGPWDPRSDEGGTGHDARHDQSVRSRQSEPGTSSIGLRWVPCRLEVLETHFKSEVDHDWDACLATFKDVPRYEIVPLGHVHEGDEAVRAWGMLWAAFAGVIVTRPLLRRRTSPKR